jgi:small conductance mechanosensitive channel
MANPAPPPPSSFIQSLELLLVNGGIHLVEAIVILSLGWMLATWVKQWIQAGLAHLPIDLTLKPLLASLVRYGVLIVTLLLVLGQFGVQTASLIALLGAAGLAVGLALQGTLSNVASGVMLLVLPFRVGHFVEIGGQQGTVREIGLFTTLLTTRDLVYVSIPNSSIFGAVAINFTREPVRRVKFSVPIDWVNDLDKVETVMVTALSANRFAVKSPPPTAVVQTLQEYGVVMTARAHVKSNDYWAGLYSMQKEVKAALDQAGILIAVARQAVAVRNEPQSAVTEPPSQEDGPASA